MPSAISPAFSATNSWILATTEPSPGVLSPSALTTGVRSSPSLDRMAGRLSMNATAALITATPAPAMTTNAMTAVTR